MQNYDICFAWNWPYDADFVALFSAACQVQGISLLQVTPPVLEPTLHSLNDRQLNFQAFFDRASDTDQRFNPLVWWAWQQAGVQLNRYDLARQACDKAAMHWKFTRDGLDTPAVLVLPSFLEQPQLSPLDLQPLGDCFAIKPVHGGGGRGVLTGAATWEQVLAARQAYPSDQYLLQAHVFPAMLGGRPAWFRILYCTGKCFPCWWDPLTHVYTPVSPAEQARFGLHALYEIPARMAGLCELELFSTEIAYTPEGRFIIVDYVNDPVDLRLQSKVKEGVPDCIIQEIVYRLVDFVTANSSVLQMASLAA
jgi:hypothetical protein